MRAAEKRKQGTSGTVSFDHLSEAEHQKLDKAAATMVYDTGFPLSFFEHTSVKAFFQQLRPAWHPPSRKMLSKSLPEDAYEDTKKEVDSYLDTQDYLNCCFDESTNIKGDRGKCYSLILSCDVRWGTYSGEFERLLLTATTLKDWTRDPRITEEARKSQKLRTVIDFIQNPSFLATSCRALRYYLTNLQVPGHGADRSRPYRLCQRSLGCYLGTLKTVCRASYLW
jgi:hypothetical protein